MPIIENDVNVIVLQHPDEIKNAKGSAIIANLYLKNYQSWVGEDFSKHKGLEDLVAKQSDNSFLIYPNENSLTLQTCFGPRGEEVKQKSLGCNLIFIDGSWRKAKRIWHSTPCLKQLKSISLTASQNSNYRIRKIPKQGYMSTIESIVACLGYVEGNRDKYRPLQNIFNKMIDAQIESMGDQVFKRNY